MTRLKKTLRITEIFHSLQGETITTGLRTLFIRLTGCPLRCQYCDTAYAFSGGKIMAIEDIMQTIRSFNCSLICVTGGEPLAQANCIELLQTLCDNQYQVSLETSGAMDISKVDPRVTIVMDIKTPASGESDKNRLANLTCLQMKDQIKFVLCNRDDYDWACSLINQYNLTKQAQVLLSPSWNQLNPTTLADWIIEDCLPVRFQLQLHKILWNDEPGH